MTQTPDRLQGRPLGKQVSRRRVLGDAFRAGVALIFLSSCSPDASTNPENSVPVVTVKELFNSPQRHAGQIIRINHVYAQEETYDDSFDRPGLGFGQGGIQVQNTETITITFNLRDTADVGGRSIHAVYVDSGIPGQPTSWAPPPEMNTSGIREFTALQGTWTADIDSSGKPNGKWYLDITDVTQ